MRFCPSTYSSLVEVILSNIKMGMCPGGYYVLQSIRNYCGEIEQTSVQALEFVEFQFYQFFNFYCNVFRRSKLFQLITLSLFVDGWGVVMTFLGGYLLLRLQTSAVQVQMLLLLYC